MEPIKDEEENITKVPSPIDNSKYCERSFISFLDDLDDEVFNSKFPPPTPRRPRRSAICSVTGLKAKYVDPVTSMSYHNILAFKIIREAYYQQLDERGDRSNPEVEKFLQWRAKQREERREMKENSRKLARSRLTTAH